MRKSILFMAIMLSLSAFSPPVAQGKDVGKSEMVIQTAPEVVSITLQYVDNTVAVVDAIIITDEGGSGVKGYSATALPVVQKPVRWLVRTIPKQVKHGSNFIIQNNYVVSLDENKLLHIDPGLIIG